MKQKFYLIRQILLLPVFICLHAGIIHAQVQTITVGSGAMISAFSPIVKTYEYVAYEAIYLSSEINASGAISSYGFNRVDGTDTLPFDSVSIFMKQTALTSLANGNYDTTGYVLVYSGVFPNNDGTGWREVTLQTPFVYTLTSNLGVMVVKHFQTATANTPVSPRWYYSSVTPNRARRYYGATPVSSATTLTATNVLSNIRMTIGTVGFIEINKSNFSVFPNPTSEYLTVNMSDLKEAQIELSDITGKKVLRASVVSGTPLPVGHLSDGMYVLRIYHTNGNLMATEKLCIKNNSN